MPMAMKARTLPAGVLMPLGGAVKRITATPASATAPKAIDTPRTRSWKRNAASGTTATGTRLPMNSALATLVLVTATKNSAMSAAKNTTLGPGQAGGRAERRPPRRCRTTIQMAEPKTSRQAAVASPGAPISFTMVEPSDSPNCAHSTAARPIVAHRPGDRTAARGAVVTPRRRGGCPARGRSGAPRARPRGRGPPPRRWPTRARAS